MIQHRGLESGSGNHSIHHLPEPSDSDDDDGVFLVYLVMRLGLSGIGRIFRQPVVEDEEQGRQQHGEGHGQQKLAAENGCEHALLQRE